MIKQVEIRVISTCFFVSSVLRLSGKQEIENGCRNKYNEIIKSSGRNIICMIKVIEEKILWKTDRLCYLFLIFLAGCMVGWIYEEIFYWITEGMLRNRGILYGPWLPIYGIGALGIYAMKPVKKYPALLFLLCAVVSGIVEYIIGYIGINFLGMRLWDYRGLFWNLDGIICFRSVVSFAVMGVMFHYMLEPAAERMVGKISSKTLRETCMVLLIIFAVDCVLSALFRTPITY